MTASQQQAAEARIRRLRTAIGAGPHSRQVDPEQHLRRILETLDDRAALRLLEREKAAA